MKESPIIFQGTMIRSIFGGFKTHTRRMVKPPPDRMTAGFGVCPYGRAGDEMWVRETFRYIVDEDLYDCILYKADGAKVKPALADENDAYIFEFLCDDDAGKWYPSIHMPRHASRIQLRRTEDARVERVADISPEDVFREGIPRRWEDAEMIGLIPILQQAAQWLTITKVVYEHCARCEPALLFEFLWNAINGKPKPVQVANPERRLHQYCPKRVTDHYVSYPFSGEAEIREYRGKPWHVRPNPLVWVVSFEKVIP